MLNHFERADDPRAYRREKAQADYARAVVGLLVRATGAYFPPQTPVVDQAREHARHLVHFAARVREARTRLLFPVALAGPTPALQRQLDACGVTWAEVEAEVARG
jgi:hypothetical protein